MISYHHEYGEFENSTMGDSQKKLTPLDPVI